MKFGELMGEDAHGNKYYENKDYPHGERTYVRRCGSSPPPRRSSQSQPPRKTPSRDQTENAIPSGHQRPRSSTNVSPVA